MQADIQRTTCDVGFMPYPVWVMHVSVQLSYRRIRRYLVLPPKEAEKHVTSSHVRFTILLLNYNRRKTQAHNLTIWKNRY